MNLRILRLARDEAIVGEPYLVVAVSLGGGRISMYPAKLQVEIGELYHDVEIVNDLEPIASLDVRTVSPEVQVPVYRKGSGEGGEEPSGGEGDHDSQAGGGRGSGEDAD